MSFFFPFLSLALPFLFVLSLRLFFDCPAQQVGARVCMYVASVSESCLPGHLRWVVTLIRDNSVTRDNTLLTQ